MKRSGDSSSSSHSDGEAESESKRCRWNVGLGRCTNPGTQLAQWGRGKTSWLCSEHWEFREEMRPADPASVKAAIDAMRKIRACPHTDPACAKQCKHARAYLSGGQR